MTQIEIEYDKVFKKHFKTRITGQKNLTIRYNERLKLFLKNRNNPALNNHKLVGRLQEKRAFNITGNIRVVNRQISENYFEFIDIGTHPQVYGM